MTEIPKKDSTSYASVEIQYKSKNTKIFSFEKFFKISILCNSFRLFLNTVLKIHQIYVYCGRTIVYPLKISVKNIIRNIKKMWLNIFLNIYDFHTILCISKCLRQMLIFILPCIFEFLKRNTISLKNMSIKIILGVSKRILDNINITTYDYTAIIV